MFQSESLLGKVFKIMSFGKFIAQTQQALLWAQGQIQTLDASRKELGEGRGGRHFGQQRANGRAFQHVMGHQCEGETSAFYSHCAIFLKEFWRLSVRLQNIQKFPGRQREMCIENLSPPLSHAQLTLPALSSLKPARMFPSRGRKRKGV